MNGDCKAPLCTIKMFLNKCILLIYNFYSINIICRKSNVFEESHYNNPGKSINSDLYGGIVCSRIK